MTKDYKTLKAIASIGLIIKELTPADKIALARIVLERAKHEIEQDFIRGKHAADVLGVVLQRLDSALKLYEHSQKPKNEETE